MFNGYKLIKNAISEREIELMYRYLAIMDTTGGLKGNTDSENVHMYFAVPYFEAMLSYYSDLVSEAVEERVYPSYSFLWNYKEGHPVVMHKDRDSVDYIISLNINNKGENNWDFLIEDERIPMDAGDILIINGKALRHGREPCPYTNRLQLILCYTSDEKLKFDRRESLGADPIPEVITDPFKTELNVDDNYVKELCEYHV
ncbi:hypothetical protein [Photobacterium minamisatsumaniensis]|uniref:hypothetical protein n=1 Tax=Photobacterium minamisatsumaniensis TaxID=2910233 RepID=UPI003D0DD6A6